MTTTPERCETHGGRSLTACSHPALFAPLTETENETLFRQLGRSAGALGLVTSFLIADGQTASRRQAFDRAIAVWHDVNDLCHDLNDALYGPPGTELQS